LRVKLPLFPGPETIFYFSKKVEGADILTLNPEELARLLISEERRKWEDPGMIISQMGVSEGATVADLGCGPGYFTIPLAMLVGSSGKVYAIDSSEQMIEHLCDRVRKAGAGATVQPIIADITERIEVPDTSVDVTLFSDVLHDIEPSNLSRFFSEVKRITKREGKIVDLDWHKRETDGNGPPVDWRLSEGEARRIIRANGLCILHAINTGPYHYGLVCISSSRT
jgi:ubiquinone/menaquinone biosynthesis C-methylase UbiE